jgi:hypothetical protein
VLCILNLHTVLIFYGEIILLFVMRRSECFSFGAVHW